MDDNFIVNLLTCSYDQSHVLKEAVALSCGDYICKNCIPGNKSVVCGKCGQTNEISLATCHESKLVSKLIESHIVDIIEASCTKCIIELFKELIECI